jgi:hypothetical protein
MLLLFGSVCAEAARTDVVYLTNGDRLTCSVKQLDRGRLRVTTDHMGVVHIDWTHIAAIEASKTYRVELTDGSDHLGELEPAEEAGVLAVRSADGVVEVPVDTVIRMTEIKRGFLRRIDGAIDVGFNYKKANNDVNYTIGAQAVYRTRRFETEFTYDSVLSDRDNADRSFRGVFEGTYTHFLKNRWFISALGGLEENQQLGLDLRARFGGTGGRSIIQTDHSTLAVSGGLTSNRERYVTELEDQTSLEGLAVLSYDYFIHGDLGADFSSSLALLPSLTESGRYRVEFDFRYRHEIVLDLFLSLSGWYSYDSQAPIAGDFTTSQDDFGLVTSIGWLF